MAVGRLDLGRSKMEADFHADISQIYKRFHSKLLQFILGRVSNRDAAEDILHEVFLKIHRRIETLRDNEKLESWMFQITRNAIVDHYRSTKQTTNISTAFDVAENDDEIPPAQRLEPCVREFVEELQEPYREALRLVEFEGMSQKELAEQLGISFSGAKSRVQRARAMLRDMLMRCCHFEFDRFGTILDYHPISCCCCDEHSKKTST